MLSFLPAGDGFLSGQEHQLVHVLGKVVEAERVGPAIAELRHPERGEVGRDHILRPFVLLDRPTSQVVGRLLLGYG